MNEWTVLYLAQPIFIITATMLLLRFYARRRLLSSGVLLYSLLAYFVAISTKVVLQIAVPTPSDPYLAGAYFGLQTSLLEVGLAYLFARSATAHRRLRVEQAPAYGADLAFWENGVLLGTLALPGLCLTIATGGAGLPSDSLAQVLSLVALGTLERTSSILAHFAWGILVVVAAITGRHRFLLAALPMGLIDFLVPFAPSFGLAEFEGIVFALSLLCLVVSYLMTREEWPSFWSLGPAVAPRTGSAYEVARPPAPSASAADTPEYRLRCGGCGAVFASVWNPFRPHIGPLVLQKCPACGRRSFMEAGVEAPRSWPPADRPLP